MGFKRILIRSVTTWQRVFGGKGALLGFYMSRYGDTATVLG